MASRFRYVFYQDKFLELVKQTEEPSKVSEETKATMEWLVKLLKLLDSEVITQELLEVPQEEWEDLLELLWSKDDYSEEEPQFWRELRKVGNDLNAEAALWNAFLRAPIEFRDFFV